MRIHVIHGPNLDRLGDREPEHYGRLTLDEIGARLHERAKALSVELTAMQSNHEGALIDALHAAADEADGVLINGAGLTHTSVALRDAVALGPPAVEVHLSNPASREPFRHTSLLAGVCVGTVSGLGGLGYILALEGLVGYLQNGPPHQSSHGNQDH